MNGSIVSDFNNQYDSTITRYYQLRWRLVKHNKGNVPHYRQMDSFSKKLQKEIDKLMIRMADDV